MTVETLTSLAIRVNRGTRNLNTVNLRWHWIANKHLISDNAIFRNHPSEAFDYSKESAAVLIESYRYLSSEYGEDNVEVVSVKIETEVSLVDLNEEVYMEERRRIALNKLTTDDIKALGLEQLAVYHKLKYYKSKKDEEDIDY